MRWFKILGIIVASIVLLTAAIVVVAQNVGRETQGELEVQIGDHISEVKRMYGKPHKDEGPSSVAKPSTMDTRTHRFLRYPGITFELIYNQVFRIMAQQGF